MIPDQRQHFDRVLEQVLAELPDQLHELLEEVPLIVEDYPARDILDEFDLNDRRSLCGLHSGIPLTERSVEHSGTLPETICIYREGILLASMGPGGRIDDRSLEHQIRITVLHEIGHHFGLDEDDLRELGYE